ncbi:hypothetical protein [Flagellimonas sp.]|uniref:hypothetical protein n=1 Tax=Flagellimonas sp. TaxID=2058762 RepID=UPI003AB386DF
MNLKKTSLALLSVAIFSLIPSESFAQTENFTNLEYSVIASGIDSPLEDLHIVCYNKFFNKDYLSNEFRNKYNLNRKELFQKKMLIQIFRLDTEDKGLDKIELIGIVQDNDNIVVEYNVVNSDTSNDNESLAPFLILQVPKSKKNVKFVANGIELGNPNEIFVDN